MFRSLAPAVLAVALTACGSGGADYAAPPIAANSLVHSASAAVQFQYYRDGSRSNPVSFIFTQDINGDGVEEVFFVAFETQPNSHAQYSNTSVQIFGWQNGIFTNITAQWLPNQTHLVEGVGDLCFGDFNGDGRVDVFLSAYTDMSLSVHPYVLINNGHSFDRVTMTPQSWMHSVACGDIDGDGFDDVVAAGWANPPTYIGSMQGLKEYAGWVGGSSGIVLGQFLGQGNLQAVVSDIGVLKANDTELYTIAVDHARQQVNFEFHSKLPTSRIGASQHDVRLRVMDFDRDGRMDVVVFGYRYDATPTTTHRGEISFFKNLGGGQFSDVTDKTRSGFDQARMIGYTPQIKDINGDGTLDIFVSQPVWESHSGITLLLNQQDKFVDSYQTELRNAVRFSSQAAVAVGPSQKRYLVVEHEWQQDGQTRITVHEMKFANH